jgi:hypothetical protein
MALQLDHLVILVHDLDAAMRDYAALGFTVTPGGTHADGLTHNALVVFADGTYLELIAFLDPDDPRDNTWGWRQFVGRGGGLIDWCVAADDLAAEVARLREHGFNVDVPTDGGRKRPDGAELRWRSARIWQAGRALPFLIEDITPRALRVPGDAATQHPNGVLGLADLVIAVADAERGAAQLAALVGAAPPPLAADRRRDAQTATIALGQGRAIVAEPGSQHSEVQRHLEVVGLGPFEVVLRSESTQTFDPRLTHGVRIRNSI